jgi:hypothetical protein
MLRPKVEKAVVGRLSLERFDKHFTRWKEDDIVMCGGRAKPPRVLSLLFRTVPAPLVQLSCNHFGRSLHSFVSLRHGFKAWWLT